MTVRQLVAGYRIGDAISSEADLIRNLLSAHGIANGIYCPVSNVAPEQRGQVRDIEKLPQDVQADDVALLHLSIGSRANVLFPELPCRRVILYHNVTPAHFLERLNPATAEILAKGRREVARLKDAAHAVYADSAFNASELAELGYRNPRVLPLIIDDTFGSAKPDPAMLAKLTSGNRQNLLFVGRIAPNKRQDQLLSVFAHYRKTINPQARLVMVGGAGSGMETYQIMLMAMAEHLELRRDVFFTGFVTDAELAACYATASAFLCLSDHEGFCAPLLEAMAWHVPVFAKAAGAVPETMDGAGVLLQDADPHVFAETVGRVLNDPALRDAVIAKQNARLARFRARDPWRDLAAALEIPA